MSARPNHTSLAHRYPEPTRKTRGRMVETIARVVTATGAITEADLQRAGFTADEIARYYADALDRSGVKRLEDTL